MMSRKEAFYTSFDFAFVLELFKGLLASSFLFLIVLQFQKKEMDKPWYMVCELRQVIKTAVWSDSLHNAEASA